MRAPDWLTARPVAHRGLHNRARGIIENIGHAQVLWSQWLLAYLPSDIATILVAWRITLWLYPPETTSLPGGIQYLKAELRKAGPWSPMEKKAFALMLGAIAFWATDFQSWQRVGWNPTVNTQFGVRFARHPQDKQSLDIFSEYGAGHMAYGQLFQQQESHWVLGIRFNIP